MKKFNFNFVFIVCKGTKVSIIAFFYFVRMEKTEFSLVSLRMIQLLNFVMSILTIISKLTFQILLYSRAKISRIIEDICLSSTISILIMIKIAKFWVMRTFDLAGLSFEIFKHKFRFLVLIDCLLVLRFSCKEFFMGNFSWYFVGMESWTKSRVRIKEATLASLSFVNSWMIV